MKSNPIIIEQKINASVEKVWQAITNKDELDQCFFEVDDFEPEIGYRFSFYSGGEEEKYLHLCKVKEIEEYKKLSYSWRYADVDGDSVVTYELVSEGDKMLFRLRHEGIETFPRNNFLFSRDSFLQGWKELIEISLKEYVEFRE